MGPESDTEISVEDWSGKGTVVSLRACRLRNDESLLGLLVSLLHVRVGEQLSPLYWEAFPNHDRPLSLVIG